MSDEQPTAEPSEQPAAKKQTPPWRFQKGKPPGPGRPKGRANNATLEVRKFSQSLFRGLFKDPNFKRALRDRIMRGKEPPQNVALLLAYAYGKPEDKILIEDQRDPLGQPSAERREQLIERLCERFATIVTQGADQARTVQTVNGRAGGAVLELEARSEAEPAATNGHLDTLADPGGTRMGQGARPEHTDSNSNGLDDDGGNSDR